MKALLSKRSGSDSRDAPSQLRWPSAQLHSPSRLSPLQGRGSFPNRRRRVPTKPRSRPRMEQRGGPVRGASALLIAPLTVTQGDQSAERPHPFRLCLGTASLSTDTDERTSPFAWEERRVWNRARYSSCVDALAKVGAARRLSALPLFAREAQVPGRRTTVAGQVLLPTHGAATVERCTSPPRRQSGPGATTDSPACKRGRSSFPRPTRCTAVLGRVGTGSRRRSGVEHRSLRLRAMVAIAAGHGARVSVRRRPRVELSTGR